MESLNLDLVMQGCVTSGANGTGNGSVKNISCDMTNLMDDMNPAEFNVMKDPLYVGIMVTLYIIVILFGALGNTLVVVTVVKTKTLWNATNIFIANLAMADILVCVFDLPLNVYYQITDDWAFGKTLCHVIPSAFAVVVYASSLSLTMIAIDRYILIVHPLQNRMSITVAMLLVVAIAVVSIAVASPIAVYAEYSEIIDPDLNINWKFCSEKWPSESHGRLYTILTLALQFFVPLIIIAILYTFIFMKVRERMSTVRSGQSSRKNKTTKMLVAVVTIFAITWTPFHLFALITEFSPEAVRGKYYKFADLLLRVVAMSSSCINPLLYGLLNDNYRNAFLGIIKRPAARNKALRGDDSEYPRNLKKPNIGNFRVSPSKNRNCNVNGKNEKSEQTTTATAEESMPLQTMDTNYASTTEQTHLDIATPDQDLHKESVDDIEANSLSADLAKTAVKKANGISSSQSPLLRT